MEYYEIGQRIRRYRKACGLSQEALAERVDISATHMSHIETGNTKLSLPVMVRLSGALGVEVDALLYDSPRFSKDAVTERVRRVLDSCTEEQLSVMAETVESLKASLDKHMG
ncbi:MAG: helix-turn-helix transcriptional regulator [Atopobiaceae bacterium]|nr:helix-turn-helix transcriptional regulator [Atopobiaceae bacterium]